MKEISMKRLVLLAVLTMFSTGFLAACNTMAGAGKDVEKAGAKIQNEAQEHKTY